MDLIIYYPNHGFSNADLLYCDWLNGYYYVADKDNDSFKLEAVSGSGDYVQYEENIVEGSVTLENEAEQSATITGLDHLEGEYVTVVSQGDVMGAGTVSSGELTIDAPRAFRSYYLGKSYGLRMRTTRFTLPQQTLDTRIKRVKESTLRHLKTEGGRIGVENDEVQTMENLNCVFNTRSKDITVLSRSGYGEDSYTVINSIEPYPMTVLATIIGVDVYED